MRTLSRHLPAYEADPVKWHVKVLAFAFLIMWVGALVIFIVQHPFVIFWALLAIVLLAAVGQGVWRKQQNALVQKMVSERASENICSFRRAFDLHQVDPWLVRATYEEVRAALGSDLEYVSAGVRASDHLVRDLMIDPDDIEDIGLRVAKLLVTIYPTQRAIRFMRRSRPLATS